MENELENSELNEDEKPYSIRHRCFFFSKEIILFVKDCKYGKVYNSLSLITAAAAVGTFVKTDYEKEERMWKCRD